VPWAREGSGFTLLFEAFIIKLAEKMPINSISRLVGEQDTRLWRIVRRHVEERYPELDFSDVTKVGFDETSQKRGHNYITVAVDLDKGSVLHVTKGRDQSTIKKFSKEFPKHKGKLKSISDVSIDMSPAFISGVASYLPDSEVTFDKFHVIKLLNTAVDEVRREESKEHDLLKGSRYIWLKNRDNLTSHQDEQLQEILGLEKMNLKTVRAYQIKLAFQELYRQPLDLAEAHLKEWYFWATHSRLEPIKKFAATVKSHWKGILKWFSSRVSNGVLEGTNSLIQEIKSRARGFKNVDNFIAMIYLKLSGICPPQST
jgi:transposase